MNRKRTAGGLLGFAAAIVVVFAAAALAVQEELLVEARGLVKEARPFVERANDVDLSMSERRAPRKEAYKRLKDARALYDRYLEANPKLEEQLDSEYVEMMVLLHGIKKDSGLGDLDKDDDPQAAASAKRPPTTPTPAPGTPPTPVAPPAPPPPALTASESLASIRGFEKTHPGDLPQIQKLYSKFLADFPDPASTEFAESAERLGKVSDRIKTVFQATAKRDFDSMSGADTKDEKAVVKRLSADLQQKDSEVKKRAAHLLVATRLRGATLSLAGGVTDKDAEVAKICRDGLVAIGGASVGDNLVTLFANGPKERQKIAMSLFEDLLKKGAPEPANQCRAIGRFTLSASDEVSAQAFGMLKSMGRVGGPGLVVAVTGAGDLDKKAESMGRMVEAKYWRGATFLAERFLVPHNADAAAAFLYKAAWDTIEKMGAYAVPHIASQVAGPNGHDVASLLSKITGSTIEQGELQKVLDWWASHKPKDAD
jgi:hypothetical protein